MESAAVLRSFQFGVSTSSHLKSVLERPGMITMNNSALCNPNRWPVCGGKTSTNRRSSLHVSCVMASEPASTAKSKGNSNGAVPFDDQQNGSQELGKKSPFSATFPNGFEALLSEVCDETKIAELKVKFGAFEIHMKRNIDGPTIPARPVVSEPALPPVPSKPANEPTSAVLSPPPKSSTEKVSPFTNVSVEKAAKLAALEAAFGSSGYVIVSSPQVGLFRRARTIKGVQRPPACNEGDVVAEGQVIGFVDQFGTQAVVKSDVDGEILKFLYRDGDAVGYGDPLIAVLPSFHAIK